MDLKSNINRIHFLISERWENVEISEKSSKDLDKYFEIKINDSKCLRLIIPFRNIDEANNFEIYYYANPLNENSELISRMITNETIVPMIEDIFEKRRFSEEYLKIND